MESYLDTKLNKSEALVLNAHISTHIKASFNFRCPKEGITYLGTPPPPPNLDKLLYITVYII